MRIRIEPSIFGDAVALLCMFLAVAMLICAVVGYGL